MERRETLNEDRGTTVSDLEALIIVIGRLLDEKLEQKPKAGITIAKGKNNERRIRYSEAKVLLDRLENYFQSKGCFSIGVCQTCASLNQSAHGNKAFGTCVKTGKSCHVWESCSDHSKSGGGFGV